MKFALTLFALFTCQLLSAQQPNTDFKVEIMPYFQGCEDLPQGSKEKRNCSNKNMISFIAENLTYPALAKEAGTEGTVYVSFIVDKKGKVTTPKVLHDIGNDCGAEALRVVQLLPEFEAGKNKGEAVPIELKLPIKFSLSTLEEDASSEYTITWGTLRGQKTTREELRNNFLEEVMVRDKQGELVEVDEMVFSYQKNKRLITAKSRGEVSDEMGKIIARAKKGGQFTIAVSVQSNGEFIYTDKTFMVME